MRRLIVTADDFGLCDGVNDGIVEAHRSGIVTATSVMVRRPAADAAAALARELPALAVGLHVDLGEWTCRDGEWVQHDWVVATDDGDAVRAEIERQLRRFDAIVGRPPTHLDSHQHVHRGEPVATVLADLADELRIPLRGRDAVYSGGFYGQTRTGEPCHRWISADHLMSIIDALPEGTTELGCHPGRGVDPALTTYATERALELAALCDPAVGQRLRDAAISLVTPG